jgi:hypothetical protein
MDEEGNLIGVKDTVDFEEREVAEPESMKLHNELLLKNALEREQKEKEQQVEQESSQAL